MKYIKISFYFLNKAIVRIERIARINKMIGYGKFLI